MFKQRRLQLCLCLISLCAGFAAVIWISLPTRPVKPVAGPQGDRFLIPELAHREPAFLGTQVRFGAQVDEPMRQRLVDSLRSAPVPEARLDALDEFFAANPDFRLDGWNAQILSVSQDPGRPMVTIDVSPQMSTLSGAGSVTVPGGVREIYLVDGSGRLELVRIQQNGPPFIIVD